MLADAKFMCRNNLIIYHSKTCAIHSFLLFLFHVWNSRNVETRPIKCDLSFSYLSPVTTNNIITKLILSRFSSNSSIFPSTSELDGPSKPRHSYSVSSFPEKSEYLTEFGKNIGRHHLWNVMPFWRPHATHCLCVVFSLQNLAFHHFATLASVPNRKNN